VLEGESLDEVAGRIRALALRVMCGEPTKAEMNGQEGILCLAAMTPAF